MLSGASTTPRLTRSASAAVRAIDHMHPAIARAQINNNPIWFEEEQEDRKRILVAPTQPQRVIIDHLHPAIARAQINRLIDDSSENNGLAAEMTVLGAAYCVVGPSGSQVPLAPPVLPSYPLHAVHHQDLLSLLEDGGQSSMEELRKQIASLRMHQAKGFHRE